MQTESELELPQPYEFIGSFPDVSQAPAHSLPEAAFFGRSNAGKSSLINAILNRKSIAKVSSTPGKTQMLNFFRIGKSLFLVDLPGFGYSKNSHTTHKKMMLMLEGFLNKSERLSVLFVLCDSQRDLPEEEHEILSTSLDKGIRTVLVRTKIDKLKQSEKAKLKKGMQSLKKQTVGLEVSYVSSKNQKGIEDLRKILWETIKNYSI